MPRLKNHKPGQAPRKKPAPLFPAAYYRPQHAGDIIGVSRSTIYGMIAKGKLRTAKVGAATVIRHEDLMAAVQPAIP